MHAVVTRKPIRRATAQPSEQAFDFLDQDWQVRVVKAEVRRRDAAMLDVGRYVLVVRKATGEAGIIMRPWKLELVAW